MQPGGFASLQYCVRMFALRTCIALLVAIGSTAAAAQARADDQPRSYWQDQWGGSLAFTSDYVYRGTSLSYGRVAYQGGAHLRLPGQWQIGVWGSTIENRFDTGTPIEATAFVAHAWTIGADWDLRAGYTHYAYYGSPTPFSFDRDELFASASFQSRLTLGINFSPNVARYRVQQSPLRGAATAIDATWSQPLVGDWSATAGVGYYDLSSLYDTGYAYGHLGVTGALGPIGLDLLYVDTDSDARYIYGDLITGPRWSATARWRF
jgi:uncharacterized protein (TIGR02001 family)